MRIDTFGVRLCYVSKSRMLVSSTDWESCHCNWHKYFKISFSIYPENPLRWWDCTARLLGITLNLHFSYYRRLECNQN